MVEANEESAAARNWERIKALLWNVIPANQIFIDDEDQVFVKQLSSEDSILGLGYLHSIEDDSFMFTERYISEFVKDIEDICKTFSSNYIIVIVKNFVIYRIGKRQILRIPQYVRYYYIPNHEAAGMEDNRELVFEDLNAEFFKDR